MAQQTSKENIITHTYDLLLYIIPQLSKYPRSQKFLLADKIQVKLMEVLEMFIQAYYTSYQGEKRDLLKAANIKLEQLRYLIRLSKDLKCISIKQYEHIQKQVNEVGKQCGGWLKILSK